MPAHEPRLATEWSCRFCKRCEPDQPWSGNEPLVCAYCHVERRFGKEGASVAESRFTGLRRARAGHEAVGEVPVERQRLVEVKLVHH